LSQPSSSGSGTLKALFLILVIVLGLLAYSLYQESVLEGQVQSLQLQNTELGLNLQAQELRLEELLLKISTTTTSTPLRFEILGVCVSVSPGCPLPSNGSSGGGYVYWLEVKNTGVGAIPLTLSVFLSFKDTTAQTSFGFNATLPAAIAPNSTAFLQGTVWPAGTNATSKLSPGDSVGVAVNIGSVENDIATAVLTCSSTTSTATGGTSTVTETTCV
jgi:hypothetical protein